MTTRMATGNVTINISGGNTDYNFYFRSNTDILSLYSYYLQSLQRLSTRVCKYFLPEVITPEFRFESPISIQGFVESLKNFNLKY